MRAIFYWLADLYVGLVDRLMARREARRRAKEARLQRNEDAPRTHFGARLLSHYQDWRLQRQQAKLMRESEAGSSQRSRMRFGARLLSRYQDWRLQRQQAKLMREFEAGSSQKSSSRFLGDFLKRISAVAFSVGFAVVSVFYWIVNLFVGLVARILARREARRRAKEAGFQRTEDASRTRFGARLLSHYQDWHLQRHHAKLMREFEDNSIQRSRFRLLSDLLKGSPAVLLLSSFAVISGWGYVKQRNAGISYWKRGEAALSEGEYKKADVYLQKALSSRDVDKARVSLTLARLYEQQGDLGRATVIMESLAPSDDIGVPEAHLFVALRMAEQLAGGTSPDLAHWKWHIDHASVSDVGLVEKLKADYFLLTGDQEASLMAAEKAAEKDPTLWLNIAIGRQQQGNVEEAKQAVLRARNAFETDYRREPGKFEYVQRYVTTLMLNNELEQAREVILEAQKSIPNEALNPLLAQLYLLYADQAMLQASVDNDPSRVSFAVRALLEAMRLSPNNPQTLGRITAISQGREKERELFRKELLKVVTEGTANEEAFFAMGVMEWTLGDIQGAIKYTRQALKLAPQMTAAANNLAMFLAEQETPDLDAALQVINDAIEQGPVLADFIDTRAQILTKRGEYDDAITDYLKLLKMVENKAYVRGKLAELYSLTGEDELASEMRNALE